MVYVVPYRNIARAFSKNALINCSGRSCSRGSHCCPYLADTMPLWQTEHGTMRIKKKKGGDRCDVCFSASSRHIPALCTSLRVYCTPWREQNLCWGWRQKSGLYFHYFIVNIAGGCHGGNKHDAARHCSVVGKRQVNVQVIGFQLIVRSWFAPAHLLFSKRIPTCNCNHNLVASPKDLLLQLRWLSW